MGLIVPKHKHSAVERNRLKRRLKELLRLDVLPVLRTVTPPLDVVVRVAPVAYTRSVSELRHELTQALVRVMRLLSTQPVPHPHDASSSGADHER